MDEIYLSYSQFLEEMKDEIQQLIHYSTIPIHGFNSNNKPMSGYLASGTLIKVKNIYGVLTAYHVWKKFRKDCTYISFVTKTMCNIHEKLEYIRCYCPLNNLDVLDICLLEIPPTILGELKAEKIFHEIHIENYLDISELKDGAWVSVGYPLAIQNQNKRLDSLSYFTHLINHSMVSKNWDKLELKIMDNDDSLPNNFGGMSGGGIWNIKCFYTIENGVQKFLFRKDCKNSMLVGVNIEQRIENGKVIKIIGMGPRSIYKGITDLIENKSIQ